MNRQAIIELITGRLRPERVRHCLGVEQYAVYMAGLYGANKAKAGTAALLHDIMRDTEAKQMLELALGYGIQPDGYELKHPMTLHAPLGAAYAQQELGIGDTEILQAIALHTTAAPGMSMLDKIIYISDALEPNRVYEDAERLRQRAHQNLDLCLLDVIIGCIELMERRGKPAHPRTYAAYDYYRKKMEDGTAGE